MILPLLLSAALPTLAQGQDSVRDTMVEVYRKAAGADNPALHFIQGLITLPKQARVERAEMERILVLSDFPTQGASSVTMLRGVTGIERDGDQITLLRDSPITFQAGAGWLSLARRVEFRLRGNDPAEAKLDKFSGVKAGESESLMVGVRWVEFARAGDGSPLAHINAGMLFVNKTITIDLEATTATVADTTPAAATPAVTAGLIDGLGQ